MSSPSDAEVIGRSLGEPEAFGLIYDRHAATLLRFLGRRAGAKVAEGLVGELFRIAFERRKTFDASRASALPWLYGIGSNLLAKHRRGEARRLRASARMAVGLEAADGRASARALDARVLFSRVADALAAQPRPRAPARTDQAERERQGEVPMKPVDLARKLRREAAFEPAALDRGKAVLMAAIQREAEARRRPAIVPQVPYQDISAALAFLEHAFGFREIPAARF